MVIVYRVVACLLSSLQIRCASLVLATNVLRRLYFRAAHVATTGVVVRAQVVAAIHACRRRPCSPLLRMLLSSLMAQSTMPCHNRSDLELSLHALLPLPLPYHRSCCQLLVLARHRYCLPLPSMMRVAAAPPPVTGRAPLSSAAAVVDLIALLGCGVSTRCF